MSTVPTVPTGIASIPVGHVAYRVSSIPIGPVTYIKQKGRGIVDLPGTGDRGNRPRRAAASAASGGREPRPPPLAGGAEEADRARPEIHPGAPPVPAQNKPLICYKPL
eukprot:5108666-Pyramimonas_sp.AAC.1